VETEPQKILGKLTGKSIKNAAFGITATCTRVPVLDGHTVCAFVQTRKNCSPEDVKKAMMEYGKDFAELHLPSSPEHLIDVTDDPFRPQPRMDRDKGGGMTVTVGRIRKDPIIETASSMFAWRITPSWARPKALCKRRSIWSNIILNSSNNAFMSPRPSSRKVGVAVVFSSSCPI